MSQSLEECRKRKAEFETEYGELEAELEKFEAERDEADKKIEETETKLSAMELRIADVALEISAHENASEYKLIEETTAKQAEMLAALTTDAERREFCLTRLKAIWRALSVSNKEFDADIRDPVMTAKSKRQKAAGDSQMSVTMRWPRGVFIDDRIRFNLKNGDIEYSDTRKPKGGLLPVVGNIFRCKPFGDACDRWNPKKPV